jgi:hypothetical protein
MDFQLIRNELLTLRSRLDELWRRFERQATNENIGGGGGVTTATPPLAITGSTISIATTPAAPGGAVALQGATPGTAQTGNLNLSGKVKAALVEAAQFLIAGVPFLDSGAAFPTSGLVDGQRFRNTTYHSWFTYDLAALKWWQESPGLFDGSFPTVSTADNTVAPKIQVTRRDLNNTVFWWDGANWHYATNQIVLLAAPARLIDANAGPYASGGVYSNTFAAVSTNTLAGGTPTPAKLAAIFGKITMIANGAGNLVAVMDNPSSIVGAVAVSGLATAVNNQVTGMFVCGVNSAGNIKITNQGSAAWSRYVIDVVGYQLDLI